MVAPPSREDRERRWAERIRAGDEAAFEALYRAYYPRLCIFAAEYVPWGDAARSVVQDVFLKIWERRAAWVLHGSPRAYLYKAVRNQALNYVKQERRKAEVEWTVEAPAVEQSMVEELHAEAFAEALWKAIDRLPERRRQVFVLHRQHEFTYEEVAQVMGITRKTVENQIGRALQFLREALGPEYL